MIVTRETLRKLRVYDRIIESCDMRRDDLRERARGLGINLDGIPGSKARTDRMAEYAAQLERLDQELIDVIFMMSETENLVRKAITELPEQQCEVMHARYLEFNQYHRRLTWDEVGRRTHLSAAHCKRIHKAAISRLKSIDI